MMSEKDYSPLSLACVKSLTDKNYDKRRQAAAEIEKLVPHYGLHPILPYAKL
jgi:vacuole morphology and inheritance protein 14